MAVGTTDAIVHVANREVEGIILIVASSNRNCGLVATKNDWHKHCTMRDWVGSDYILGIHD
jgi:hypothetical protein